MIAHCGRLARIVVLFLDHAQSQGNRTFEVTSVTPNRFCWPAVRSCGRSARRRQIYEHRAARLIRRAYRLQEYQVLGGPHWISVERFDVVAKTMEPASVDAKWLMVRSLLAWMALSCASTPRAGIFWADRLVRAEKGRRLGCACQQLGTCWPH